MWGLKSGGWKVGAGKGEGGVDELTDWERVDGSSKHAHLLGRRQCGAGADDLRLRLRRRQPHADRRQRLLVLLRPRRLRLPWRRLLLLLLQLPCCRLLLRWLLRTSHRVLPSRGRLLRRRRLRRQGRRRGRGRGRRKACGRLLLPRRRRTPWRVPPQQVRRHVQRVIFWPACLHDV